jgi:hypothetical protein
MTDPSKLAKRKSAGSKARAVREKMDKLRAERLAEGAPRGPELFELCAQCGRPLAHWFWRPVQGAPTLRLEKICADCSGVKAERPKECRL